ncbi:MAG: patatin-like phospholipase family protein [Polaromonas sp.]|nr:patatin-like phospholipase family protein [Polaromonas sp.]
MLFGKSSPLTVNLALQGGGAHGAFTWGVLDQLLDDGRLDFEGVSGTSAGAMNAVVLAHGLNTGGRDGAREALEKFWTGVASSLPFEVAVPSSDGQNVSLLPAMKMLLQWAHYFSPQQLNPFDLNPLRGILQAQVDFERLRAQSPLKLFIAATHANSGKVRLFRTPEISADAVLASGCLPTMARPVEIEGEPYWDGGYAANPAVYPLFYECKSSDIVMVLLTPLAHKGTPRSAQEIKDRVLELAFNSTFLREMQMFAHAREFARDSFFRIGRLERRLVRMNFHVIDAPAQIHDLKTETKLAANLRFFTLLRDLGRAQARLWLQAHQAQVGKDSTVDIAELFH